ncbi:MAG: family efflux transporter [Chitinophagaceae bacterium]|nr:family efflux transporter [Chitinophagaceae bacterium]
MIYSQHIRKLLLLAYPVTLAQLGHISVALADTYMAGKLGGMYLAAATLAFSFYFPFLFFGIGISSGPSPLIAKAQGENDRSMIQSLFWQSLHMNIIVGVLLTAFIYLSASRIHWFNSDPVLLEHAIPFLHIIALSVLPTMIFQSFRQYAEGLSSTSPSMFISIFGTVVNVFFNWVFTRGALGFPELGLNGIALGTLISRVVMALMMAAYVLQAPLLNQYLKGAYYMRMQWTIMRHMLKKSFPVGIQLSVESGVFSLGAIFIGWLGTTAIASHQIALNLAATSYMAATGLTAAVSVRVGYEWGAGNVKEIRKAGLTAFGLVSVFMLSVSVLFILFRYELPALFVMETDIINTTAGLLLTAALFQLADGVQVIGIGALRGIGDVVAPTLIAILAYWAIGLPIGYWLTFSCGMGVQGIWYGFTIGLFIAAVLMFVRFMVLSGKMRKN